MNRIFNIFERCEASRSMTSGVIGCVVPRGSVADIRVLSPPRPPISAAPMTALSKELKCI
ncbi:hypothetical protein F441_10158 [Phytophthora nicotianae CJ01A1]|uniref:Uncharacterized protein n=7 Tax=Phytophthora nicotianae TaxID=4792 RepID=W2R7Y0_PHYN3|nr:hypothetical protein PPTG_21093 [Phytophthora nicotianae INRA-310]ETI45123.1 hypothetical protein F443_10223 [Phytophthora nicotianae P1569]ETL38518.1 hypothetical protein L916_09907 [Phytophthora nicotianae]ETO73756.1 hypothetical protein F444_10324 [Phytophthora nicotianae P1976]ETP14942.1 hypothetical protein F441_10158 [Phytophthora nicotianae CJ01A1]ETP43007.1 hypothetical protein F442_10126 [Phytophthora nicotianae P10297]